MKILFIDDNKGLQEAMRQHVEPLGYEIKSVSTAEEAFQLLKQGFAPNVILVDIILRGRMSGEEFIKSISPQDVGRNTVPVVVLTSGSDIIPGLPPGVPVLRKPVSPDTIMAALRENQEITDCVKT